MARIRRVHIILALLFAGLGLTGALTAGAVVWRVPGRHSGGTPALTSRALACIEEAKAFTGYPLLFAGENVLGYPLTSCQHTRTDTWNNGQGLITHDGGDSFGFAYGDCTIPEGRENCPIPITINIVLRCGPVIPAASLPKSTARSVRGVTAGIDPDGRGLGMFLSATTGLGISVSRNAAGVLAADPIAIADALVPANPLAAPLTPGGPLTALSTAPVVPCPPSRLDPKFGGPPIAPAATPAP